MQTSSSMVTYLGFKINNEGTAHLPEKVATMTGALPPKNVVELKAYHAVVNYYYIHLPNLSNILESLHSLMKKSTA